MVKNRFKCSSRCEDSWCGSSQQFTIDLFLQLTHKLSGLCVHLVTTRASGVSQHKDRSDLFTLEVTKFWLAVIYSSSGAIKACSPLTEGTIRFRTPGVQVCVCLFLLFHGLYIFTAMSVTFSVFWLIVLLSPGWFCSSAAMKFSLVATLVVVLAVAHGKTYFQSSFLLNVLFFECCVIFCTLKLFFSLTLH